MQQQIAKFIQSKPDKPSIPLLLISPLDVPKETVQCGVGAYELLDQSLISQVRVDRIDNTVDYNNEVSVRDS